MSPTPEQDREELTYIREVMSELTLEEMAARLEIGVEELRAYEEGRAAVPRDLLDDAYIVAANRYESGEVN